MRQQDLSARQRETIEAYWLFLWREGSLPPSFWIKVSPKNPSRSDLIKNHHEWSRLQDQLSNFVHRAKPGDFGEMSLSEIAFAASWVEDFLQENLFEGMTREEP
jgi:hypothetical protein